jgi:hypothetical protein
VLCQNCLAFCRPWRLVRRIGTQRAKKMRGDDDERRDDERREVRQMTCNASSEQAHLVYVYGGVEGEGGHALSVCQSSNEAFRVGKGMRHHTYINWRSFCKDRKAWTDAIDKVVKIHT